VEALLPPPSKHMEAADFHRDILNRCSDQGGFSALVEKTISKYRSQEQMQCVDIRVECTAEDYGDTSTTLVLPFH